MPYHLDTGQCEIPKMPVGRRQGRRIWDRASSVAVLLPNLNLLERLRRFVKKEVLYSTYYDKFEVFRNSVDTCISELGSRFNANMQTLIIMKFHLFSEKTEHLTV